jgi:hypothetical protein
MGRDAYRILLGKPERKSHLKYSGVDGRIILKLGWENGLDRAGSG